MVDHGWPDAIFDLSITSFGLIQGQSSNTYKPLLEVHAFLKAKSGLLVWQAKVRIDESIQATPDRPFDLWTHFPKLVRQGFRQATALAVEALIADLSSL